MNVDDRDKVIAHQQALLDDLDARLTATEASENYWRKKARDYRGDFNTTQQALRELQQATAEMAPAPDKTMAASLLVTIHEVLRTDRSDRVIDNIMAMIEEHWRATGQPIGP